MKKIIYMLIVLIISACNSTVVKNDAESNTADTSMLDSTAESDISDSHDAENSLDIMGVYKGVLPCADCSGIEITLEILDEQKFKRSSRYLGKEDTKIRYDEGMYSWIKDKKNTIILNDIDKPNEYFVAEGSLIHLDMNGNKIEGKMAEKYILKKQD